FRLMENFVFSGKLTGFYRSQPMYVTTNGKLTRKNEIFHQPKPGHSNSRPSNKRAFIPMSILDVASVCIYFHLYAPLSGRLNLE
ncbi:MAG: hypothetical protein L0287_07790, partial [Anaerolineae bacterium]|nr:hypothetical protein [Anaerolineae bacterium]